MPRRPRPYVALLRGINIGPNKRVPMAELRELATGLGYEEVATHLNSGNLVLRSDATPETVVTGLEEAIEGRFGFTVSVVLRDDAQIAAILRHDPFAGIADDGSRSAVALFDRKVPAALAAAAREADAGQGRVDVHGTEIHVWCPDGLNSSAPMEVLLAKPRGDLRLTVRNRNTLDRIARMLGERASSRGGR